MQKLIMLVITLLMIPVLIYAQPVKEVTDAMIPVGAHVTFSADTIYVLDGMVFVDSLAVLTIEPGTVVKAKDGQGNQASGLVVTRFGKIYAEGTADRPIIFTSINDDLKGNLKYSDRGLWGGIVLLGQASTNNTSVLRSVEGVNEIVAAGDTRAMYGGTDDDHSSGVIRYVSIRHSGINVGDVSGNEIQGLTLGAVGRGTVIEYVESFASADDGFEWFGGTVNTKYLVSAFNEDDSYDTDEGFRGKGQFWFAIQATDKGGRVAEMDGAIGDEYYQPYSHPIIANATYIGAGIGATPEGDGAECIILRDNTGVEYYNSIFTEYDDASSGYGLTIEDIDNTGAKTEDSRMQFEAGRIIFQNNLWYGFGAGNAVNEFIYQDFAQSYFADPANANQAVDPMLNSISREPNGGLNPLPKAGSPALSGAKMLDDNFFVKTSYVGAFGGNNWLKSWTALDQLGYLGTISAVDDNSHEAVSKSFVLEQNYPNPFNPVTSITFNLPVKSQVKLSVYNVLGQEVAIIANGVRTAGTHKVAFDAASLPSGLYLYRLEAGSVVLSKKLMLLK